MIDTNPLQNTSEAQQAAMFRELLSRNNRDEFIILSEDSTTLTSPELVASLQASLAGRARATPELAPQQLERALPLLPLDQAHTERYFLPPDCPSLSELAASSMKHVLAMTDKSFSIDRVKLMADRLPLITVRNLFPELRPALGELCMKPPAQCYGWVAKMQRLGYRVSTKLEGHGRQRHIIRKGDLTFSILQGCTTALRYSVGPLSMFDYQVVNDLKKVGVLVDTGQPAKATQAPAPVEAL